MTGHQARERSERAANTWPRKVPGLAAAEMRAWKRVVFDGSPFGWDMCGASGFRRSVVADITVIHLVHRINWTGLTLSRVPFSMDLTRLRPKLVRPILVLIFFIFGFILHILKSEKHVIGSVGEAIGCMLTKPFFLRINPQFYFSWIYSPYFKNIFLDLSIKSKNNLNNFSIYTHIINMKNYNSYHYISKILFTLLPAFPNFPSN